MLGINDIVDFPGQGTIDRILNCSTIDIVSPFYSRWALRKLEKRRYSRVRLITRLPNEYHTAPTFLENDPRPLKITMKKLGIDLQVFRFPSVHAKLYLSTDSAWAGSANFTQNGFSGKAELLLNFPPPFNDLSEIFDRYLTKSVRINIDNIQFLIDCVKLGLTTLSPERQIRPESPDTPVAEAVSYEDFGEWLKSRGQEGQYLIDRIGNKYRMSGHVFSGYHGILAFLMKEKGIGSRLLGVGSPNERILIRLAGFVKKYGSKYGGPRGGIWNSKLSRRLGGTQSGGGAGDVVVKRLLIEVPQYMRHKHLL
jgi:hypothetical protein